jgi:hypothetical protein
LYPKGQIYQSSSKYYSTCDENLGKSLVCEIRSAIVKETPQKKKKKKRRKKEEGEKHQ